MAAPREWEIGDGIIETLRPDATDLYCLKERGLSLREYFIRFEKKMAERLAEGLLAPDMLSATLYQGRFASSFPVPSGATACCSCPRPGSERRVHRCHLEWAAPYLVRAGWEVVLYGRKIVLQPGAGVFWDDNGVKYMVSERG